MTGATDAPWIHIPPEPEHVASIRAFVGAMGRHAGCSDEVIDDLRLAVTEACAQALEQDAAPTGIEVRTWPDGDRLRVEIEPCGRFDDPDPQGEDNSTRRWALLRALSPDATVSESDGGAVLRLTAPAGDGTPP